MAVGDGFHKGRVAEIFCPDGRQELVLFLDEPLGLGQDDQVPLVADGLEEADGDRVGHAAVQQGIVADLDDLCGQRHGGRCFHPLDVLSVTSAALVVNGVAGLDVGADDKKIHGRGAERLGVEGIQLFGHIVVAELLAVQIAGADQVLKAGIPLVVAILGVVADGAPDLVGFVVAAEHRASRNADRAVRLDAVFHQHIQDACGEHTAHRTALHDQSCLHIP